MMHSKSIVLFFLAIFFAGLLVLLIDYMNEPSMNEQPDFQAYSRKQILLDLDKIK